ncbi:hypothetical protein HDU93_000255 [Gonapodya sp. JEL0774]|nr:hypothetical protein HDU93_000255 [Gonapodya sp. JEL0774]
MGTHGVPEEISGTVGKDILNRISTLSSKVLGIGLFFNRVHFDHQARRAKAWQKLVKAQMLSEGREVFFSVAALFSTCEITVGGNVTTVAQPQPASGARFNRETQRRLEQLRRRSGRDAVQRHKKMQRQWQRERKEEAAVAEMEGIGEGKRDHSEGNVNRDQMPGVKKRKRSHKDKKKLKKAVEAELTKVGVQYVAPAGNAIAAI